MERDFTTGNVFRNIIYYSIPYLLSYFLQTLYGMADLFIIGRFEGVAATTAVSIGGQVMHMVTVMLVGLAMGTTVSIAQAVGAKRRKEASHCIGNTVTLFMALSVVLAGVLVMCVRPIVGLVSTPAEAVEGTVTYLTICFAGIPFITAYNIISSIFRGLGDSKSPMYFIAVACAANIVLDYLFMGAMHLGPAGAALGTTLSQAVSVAISLWVILHRKDSGISVRKTDFRPNKPVISRIFSIGLPVAFQDGLIQVSFIIITIIANRRGLTDAAAVGIVEKIISLLFLIPSSMLSTVSALGAQNIGAGKKERAVQTLRYAIGIGISEERLKAGEFSQYDSLFLLLDEGEAADGNTETEMPCVSVCFCGHHRQSPAWYERLCAYIREHGLEISGFSREITLIDQRFTDDLSQYDTEISIPIYRRESLIK